MLNPEETLDRIARSGEAVFATDGADRIILWNKACGALVGKAARDVLGKRCYDVMGGRDVNGNVYCQRRCPVSQQARDPEEQPVNPFELTVETGDGKTRRLANTLFSVPSYHPALTKLVHVLRPSAPIEPAPTPRRDPVEPAPPSDPGAAAALTAREKEVLSCLVRGMGTAAIGRQLSIARVTVRNHVQNILQKLSVHSKLEAVALANRLGLV